MASIVGKFSSRFNGANNREHVIQLLAGNKHGDLGEELFPGGSRESPATIFTQLTGEMADDCRSIERDAGTVLIEPLRLSEL